jgi:S1-C subfamily serine protease
MYRIASQSFLNNVDRQPQIALSGLLDDVKRLKSKEETIHIPNTGNACSSIYTLNGSSEFVGSGGFVTMGNDLKKGYFLTAAHCVLKNNSYTIMDQLYVTNPIDNTWHNIDVNFIYLDGVADIALIQTNIDFTNHRQYCLQFSSTEADSGDTCYVCGNPGGLDTDSISKGVVRDGHHTIRSGSYVPDAIYIDTAGIAGNSGSPILNIKGRIIGLFLFGIVGSETLNGGANLNTLKLSLNVLRTGIDYRTEKLYLGMNWYVPNAFTTFNYYQIPSGFPKQGLIITSMDTTNSPFYNDLQQGDLVLSYTIQNKKIELGALQHQRTLGQLIYTLQLHPTADSIKFHFIRISDPSTVLEVDIDISNAMRYDNPVLSSSKDLVLIGGGG